MEKIGGNFGVGIISGSIWGSFRGWGSSRGRDHFGVGIISGSGSFRGRDHLGGVSLLQTVGLWEVKENYGARENFFIMGHRRREGYLANT